ncbi:hypothetical protein [Egicoccus sp. AB-alg2]|uniref:hypothetical protein n=1 Tax=Egicoccus sp. AB-alg2 TaxID=3242693 RepID=UPI00359CF2F0
MNRRASLPGADELFRATSGRDERPGSEERSRRDEPRGRARLSPAPDPAADAPEASGRVRHDQKITVYLTAQELLDLEQARLRLRAEFDIAVDRGRIVREAVAELLQELHERGPDAAVVRRLS